jgi:uncharacterized protein (TIGR02421 family)
MPPLSYPERVRALSERLVAAQRGIRVLDSVKWDDGVRVAFFEAGCRALPPVDAAYYGARPLGFDPEAAREELHALARTISSDLGRMNPVGQLMERMCDEYLELIDMLEARGTPAFGRIARRLYGSASDAFHAGGPTLADLAASLDEALGGIDEHAFLDPLEKDIPTGRAVEILQARLDRVFGEPGSRVRVIESDGIVADAAAGSDYIKLRRDAKFSDRDLRLLEAHEGWVHVGTTLNGQRQPWCTFLAKGTPSTTITQEGLALLAELIAGASHPGRLRRVTDRVDAIRRAEDGADFVEVFEALRARGRNDEDAYAAAVRVFRGSTPDGAPFTKDLAYHQGFVQVYNFMQLAVQRGRLDRIPLLFCGKLTLDDVGTIASLVEQGLVERPHHMPPPLADLSGFAAWLAYGRFLNTIDLGQVEADYARLLA